MADPSTYGKRTDGTPKGLGFFGEIPRQDDPKSFSTELSATMNLGGKDILLPLLVPTLTHEEITALVAGQAPTKAMYDKAAVHAIERLKAGKSPFAGAGEQVPLPTSQKESFTQGFQQEQQNLR